MGAVYRGSRTYKSLSITAASIGGSRNAIPDTAFIDDTTAIADGGAAMSAYAKMQFTEMTSGERERIVKALLKYCELDTFAMVLVWEGLAYWMNEAK